MAATVPLGCTSIYHYLCVIWGRTEMLKVLSGVSILALAATTASAADLALGAPAAAPVAFTWTGCHVGGHVGGLISDEIHTSSAGVSADHNATAFVGGGQIGCDYQFAPKWVVGAEGRAAWNSLKFSYNSTIVSLLTGAVVAPTQVMTTNDFLASATGRLGYVYGGGLWMAYARGGVAWTRDRYEDPFIIPAGPSVDPSATTNRTGWTVGGGVEWAFAPHWSANLEFNYYDFGTQTIILTNAVPVVNVTTHVQDQFSATTVGVNYHF
jgi:outer membrane immunogenic protein